jgi:DNA-binding response OmpR family regulator
MSALAHSILLVNHLPGNLHLLVEFLGKAGYATVTAATYEELDQVLSQQPSLSGALIDIAGFDAQIWSRCEQLRAGKIPFLVISPRQSVAVQQASFSHGARGVMVKPLIVKELIGVIQSILVE